MATNWSNCKDEKQAEFLIEQRVPWKLIDEIGVHSFEWADRVNGILVNEWHKPRVNVKNDWYY